jgi:hypothetical protein
MQDDVSPVAGIDTRDVARYHQGCDAGQQGLRYALDPQTVKKIICGDVSRLW